MENINARKTATTSHDTAQTSMPLQAYS